jgi:hypothetical protein
MNGFVGKFVHPTAVAIDYDMFRVHSLRFFTAAKVTIIFLRTQFQTICSIISLKNPYKQGLSATVYFLFYPSPKPFRDIRRQFKGIRIPHKDADFESMVINRL